MMKTNQKILIGIGILVVLVAVTIFFNIIGFIINPIIPTDTKIARVLQDNEESLLSIEGVVGAGIAQNESNNHIIGIAVYVEDTADTQKIPSRLEEFKVFTKRVSETTEAEEKTMMIYRFYPAEVKNTIFDDSEKIQNTASFLIQTYDPLFVSIENRIQILRNSGVRVLETSDIPTVYHSLIEEDKANEVKNLDFVKAVYSYKTR